MTNTVLVSNLPAEVTASHLEDMFTAIGNVKQARIVLDLITGKSSGQGYVEMTSPEEADNCILHFNGQTTQGRRLLLRRER